MSDEVLATQSGPVDDAFFQGFTKAQIATIFTNLTEIKDDVKELKENLTDLDRWKNRTVGMCTIIAFTVPLVVDYLKGFIK